MSVGGTASAVLCPYGAASFGGVPGVAGVSISIFSGGGTAAGTGFCGPDETGGDDASRLGCGCGFVFGFCSMFFVFCLSGVCDHAGMLNPAMAVARGARLLPDPFAKFTFGEARCRWAPRLGYGVLSTPKIFRPFLSAVTLTSLLSEPSGSKA